MTGIGWVEAHGIEVNVAYFLFSCIVGGMPTPKDTASVGYRWIFTTLSLAGAGFARVFATQLPESKLGQALQSGPPIAPVVVAKPDAVEPPKEK